WAVVEADEYDARFLRLSPTVAIVTSVEADHLDFYGDLAGVRRAFAAFIARLPRDGALIACADDPIVRELVAAAPCRVVTYALDSAADWTARETTHGALVIDDYAHHPTEIRVTLAGLRARYPGRRLRVAFQPHTYTRTRAFLAPLGASFGDADEVAVAEVYAARETDTLGVSGRDVA